MTACDRLKQLLEQAAAAVEAEDGDARIAASDALLSFQRRTRDAGLGRLAGAAVGALANAIGDKPAALEVLAGCESRRAARCS